MSYAIDGEGPPLLLLHAFGLSRHVWSPVLPFLVGCRRVITVDLPGHGDSSLPAPGVRPNPQGYATALMSLLDDLGIDQAHIAGNSIGGWTALELALSERAQSVVALSPAGLWVGDEPVVRKVRFVVESRAARLSAPILRRLVSRPWGRQLLFGEAMESARSLPTEDAQRLVEAYARVRHITKHVTSRDAFTGGEGISVPVTVAWGAQDRFIPAVRRSHAELPPHSRFQELPGCGHVMMWDNPELVANTIIEGTGGR